MGITLFSVAEWLAPLLAFPRGPWRRAARRPAPAPSSHAPTGQSTIGCPTAVWRSPVRAATEPARSGTRPLRVVRVTEAGQQAGCTGRMVLSGRMADVCAELDRLDHLAKRETRH